MICGKMLVDDVVGLSVWQVNVVGGGWGGGGVLYVRIIFVPGRNDRRCCTPTFDLKPDAVPVPADREKENAMVVMVIGDCVGLGGKLAL